jgi:uncharacterized repeat protein (TIGR02543 family)
MVYNNMTVYANWTRIQYTVTFDADGGSPSTRTRTVTSGGSVGSANMPVDPARDGHDFGGWYIGSGSGTEFTGSTPVTGDITVYARWISILPSDLSLAASLAWINANAAAGRDYAITVHGDESIAPQTLSYGGKTVRITLNGDTTERTVSVSAAGSLFTVGNEVTLTLGNNITLQGRPSNTAALVTVNGGTLVMNSGAKVSGNTSSSYSGGGVYVSNNGTFTMNGGTISDNTSFSGGGVYMGSGTFTMNEGTISGNTASSSSAYSYGGGVYINSGTSGTFTMNGGTISGNTVSSSSSFSYSSSYGGGVYIISGTFTMNEGTISGNTASSSYYSPSYGGGVNLSNNGTFTMSGGTICGNTASSSASSYGGGVNVTNGGTFTMNDGTISGNTASSSSAYSYGGGVGISNDSTFTMSGGTISGNTTSLGGGVYVMSGTFTKQSGGTIYGSNAGSTLKNTADNDSRGHAVYVSGSKIRNTTAGPGVTLDSGVSGAAGGWE